MSVWLPRIVYLLVKSWAGFKLQIDLTKHQQGRGLMPRKVNQLIDFEVIIMSLTLPFPSIDHLQAKRWTTLGMAHHNFSMLRLLSVSISLYHRINEKNNQRRLSRVSTILATSSTMLSKTRPEILTSDIRVLRPWAYKRSFPVPIFRRFLPYHAT